jgi:hypothetical protein
MSHVMCVTSHMTKRPLNKKTHDFMSSFPKKNETKKCFGGQNIKIWLKEIVRM